MPDPMTPARLAETRRLVEVACSANRYTDGPPRQACEELERTAVGRIAGLLGVIDQLTDELAQARAGSTHATVVPNDAPERQKPGRHRNDCTCERCAAKAQADA